MAAYIVYTLLRAVKEMSVEQLLSTPAALPVHDGKHRPCGIRGLAPTQRHAAGTQLEGPLDHKVWTQLQGSGAFHC